MGTLTLAPEYGNKLLGPSAYRVRFLDADGTVLSTQYVISGGSATPPANPSLNANLSFSGWCGSYASVTSDIDIIASYSTVDGFSWYNIQVNAISGLGVTMLFTKSDTSTITIYWGDGQSSTSSSSGAVSVSHTYASAGNYSIRSGITSGTGTVDMGQGSGTTQLFGNIQKDILLSAWLRAGQTNIKDYAFSGQRQLKYCIGQSVTSIGANAFQSCVAATSFSFPVATSIGANAFQSCRTLAVVNLGAPSMDLIDAQSFDQCYAINTISISATTPPTLTSTNAFALQAYTVINVPAASLNAYKTATNWSAFAAYMVGV